MYKINKEDNNIIKLEQRLFSELGFRERENLQEWIAKNPDVLGEDLLIIQKEFDGFNNTNERLDLLALDKDANLVIIENKLDDTGKDVVWQALKYTSYCSTLTTKEIIKMYQDYLDQYENNEDATTMILDFLEIEEELILNRKDQRIVFIANNYRREVTSTVLWLLNHDIQVQCFRAIPYSMGDDLFLQIEQIIPLPETKEYMIDAKEKEKEVTGKSKIVAESESLLIEFWKQQKDDLNKNKIHFLDNTKSMPHYNLGFWKEKAKFSMVLGRDALRVELYMNNDKDKKLFDAMYQFKDEIDSKFDGVIIWERLDNKKASRIKAEMPIEIIDTLTNWKDKETWEIRINWFTKEIVKFYDVIYPIWKNIN
jgi:hypothetical protein